MKRQIMALGIAGMVSLTFFYSCKKSDEKATLDPKFAQFNSDNNNYKGEADQADNDINSALSEIPAFGKSASGTITLSSPLCGVTIDSSQLAQKILYFNFDGVTPCFSPSRTRSGQIKVQLTSGTHWSDVGAVLTETFINYKITRLSDSKSITINGVKTLKNLNGNNWFSFVTSAASLKYQERAFNINVTFDNNLQAVWNSARTTEWKYVQATTNPAIPYIHITFSSMGDTTLNGYTAVDSWGVNRFGYNFTTNYMSALKSNTYCGLWRFNSGELVHHVNNSEFRLILGLDQNGNPTPFACAYGYKVMWTVNGNSNEVILSY